MIPTNHIHTHTIHTHITHNHTAVKTQWRAALPHGRARVGEALAAVLKKALSGISVQELQEEVSQADATGCFNRNRGGRGLLAPKLIVLAKKLIACTVGVCRGVVGV